MTRTRIELDEVVLEQAFRCAKVKTKKALVNLALEEFVEHHGRADIRELLRDPRPVS
jgi:Arc/MetJ family transcription regulator